MINAHKRINEIRTKSKEYVVKKGAKLIERAKWLSNLMLIIKMTPTFSLNTSPKQSINFIFSQTTRPIVRRRS